MMSNTTALLILLAILFVVLVAMAIVAVLWWRSRSVAGFARMAETNYFAPYNFPEIERDPERFARDDDWPRA